ncbi:MAG: P1 family peptidase [Proteocatella sp.]
MGNVAKIGIDKIKVGQTENSRALTGVTVIVFEGGAIASLDVRGSAPGSRETELLRPGKTVEKINAIVLSGGSAFGLEAGCGVMRYLEEQEIGLKVAGVTVPIVSQAIIFDLGVGNPGIRPDMKMGYDACKNLDVSFRLGNYGAGCGATVGKILGAENSMKGGIGYSEIKLENGLIVGAIICVNAVGDVFDETGIIAGALNENGDFADTAKLIMGNISTHELLNGNTTIGCIITNAKVDKTGCQKISEVAHNGLAQSISPIHTSMDGDTIFTAATGELECQLDQICVAAQLVTKNAVISAIKNAEKADIIKAYGDVLKKS